MNKCRLSFYNNFSETTNLASSPTVTTNTSLSYLNDARRSRVAGWNSGSNVVTGNYAGGRSTGCFVIAQHTMPSAATYRIELFSDPNQTGTTLYDSGVQVVGDRETIVEWFADVSAKSFRLTLSAVVSFRIGRVFMGPVFSPGISVGEQFNNELVDMTRQMRTAAGSIFAESQPTYKRLNFLLHYVTLSEYDYITQAMSYVGTKRDVFVSLFPENGDQLEYNHQGIYKFQTPIREQPAFVDTYKLQFQLEGV